MDPMTMMMLAQAGMSLLGGMQGDQAPADSGVLNLQNQALNAGAAKMGGGALAPMMAQNMVPNNVLGQVLGGGFAPGIASMAPNTMLFGAGPAIQDGEYGALLPNLGALAQFYDFLK